MSKQKMSPGSSREDVTPGVAAWRTIPLNKTLPRSAVVLSRVDPQTCEVRVASTNELVGTVRRFDKKKGGYSYKLLSETRGHAGFATQKAAVERMLKKV